MMSAYDVSDGPSSPSNGSERSMDGAPWVYVLLLGFWPVLIFGVVAMVLWGGLVGILIFSVPLWIALAVIIVRRSLY
jgi:hypothetical protein